VHPRGERWSKCGWKRANQYSAPFGQGQERLQVVVSHFSLCLSPRPRFLRLCTGRPPNPSRFPRGSLRSTLTEPPVPSAPPIHKARALKKEKMLLTLKRLLMEGWATCLQRRIPQLHRYQHSPPHQLPRHSQPHRRLRRLEGDEPIGLNRWDVP
jgi:hypothetical protein